MDEESKRHAEASLDFWARGKAVVSPKYDPRHQHQKSASTAVMKTDKEKVEDAKKREMDFLERGGLVSGPKFDPRHLRH